MQLKNKASTLSNAKNSIRLDVLWSKRNKIDCLVFREIDFERIQLHNQFGLNVNI